MKLTHRLAALVCTCLLGVTIVPGAALAGALYNGLANLTLTLASVNGGTSIPDGVGTRYQTGVLGSSTLAEGNASAAAVETLQPGDIESAMGIGDRLIQVSNSYGQAGNSAGYATSLMQTDGIIVLSNQSNASVTVRLVYDFSAEVTALIDEAGRDAGADAGWSIGDDLGNMILSNSIFADAILGPQYQLLTLTDYFELVLAPTEERILYSMVDSSGFAEAPAPPVWALLGAGFGLFAAIRRRTRGVRSRVCEA